MHFKIEGWVATKWLVGLVALLSVTSTLALTHPVVNIQRWKTSNGARVYFVATPNISMVDIQVLFAAGSSRDRQLWGLAALTNAMLAEGAGDYSANEISTRFDDVGAAYGASVDRDTAALSLRSLSSAEYLNSALQTFASVLTKPTFTDKAFDRVKQQTLTGIRYSQQSPDTVAKHAFYQVVYGDHPYGHPPEGIEATVKQLTAKEVAKFYQRYYVASNAKLIIVGNITRQQAQKMGIKIIGRLPRGKAADTLKQAETSSGDSYTFIKFPAKQNTILLGQVSHIEPASPDYFAFAVGNRTLGGAPLASILFNQVRNQRGLAYGVYSVLNTLRYGGPFYIGLQTRTDKAKQALTITRQALIQFMKNGPTSAQLRSAQRNMVGAFPLKLATNAGIMANVARIAFYHLPLDFLDTYRSKVEQVNGQQVRSSFQRTIDPKEIKVVVVGAKNDDSKTAAR